MPVIINIMTHVSSMHTTHQKVAIANQIDCQHVYGLLWHMLCAVSSLLLHNGWTTFSLDIITTNRQHAGSFESPNRNGTNPCLLNLPSSLIKYTVQQVTN